MNIIGISAFFHDSACCLLRDGQLMAAAEEERFSRIKFDPGLPVQAFQFCLRQGGMELSDIDCIAYYEDPYKKFSRQLWMLYPSLPPASQLGQLHPARAETEIREVLGFRGPMEFADHHQSHAASAFYFSGMEEAAIMTVDGVGEWTTTGYGYASGGEIILFEEVRFPDSLGLLYNTITSYLGFSVNEDEYKVMGLAPYGKPAYVREIYRLIQPLEQGQYRLNMRYFDFLRLQQMYSKELVELFEHPPRTPESEILPFHQDVACSLQVVLEEILLAKARYLHERTRTPNLCMAGGVALNCVANSRILRQGPFKRLFVQPAANDAGCCLGAAAIAHVRLTGEPIRRKAMQHLYLGPAFSPDEVADLCQAAAISAEDHRGHEEQLLQATAARLAAGQVVGWFHGRMEFGPRALGARSILADPRNPGMRDRINYLVKRREAFRPFAPAVLESKVRQHFDLDHPSCFMLETCRVCSPLELPSITHVDGSARVQTVSESVSPRFTKLLHAFERRTGCPILLNTSFNVRGEPIVCTPADALSCFITSGLDALVLEDFIIDREALSSYQLFQMTPPSPAISHTVYTFV